MKINVYKPLKKHKSIYVHSVFYPGPGYVAIPENKSSEFNEEKQKKSVKGLSEDLTNLISIIKHFLYDIVSICKKRERGKLNV